MLHEFLTSNYDELIKRCREQTKLRFDVAQIPPVLDRGVPLFVRQLAETLRSEQATSARNGTEFDGAHGPEPNLGRVAALHGAELLRLGYSIDQVVHEYGDVCQSVTAMAVEQREKISAAEFRTMNRCLDDAIADAVSSFGSGRETSLDDQARIETDRLTAFSDEHRRLVDIALQAFAAIRTGNVGLTGATGALLTHTLDELRALGERLLSDDGPAPAADAATRN